MRRVVSLFAMPTTTTIAAGGPVHDGSFHSLLTLVVAQADTVSASITMIVRIGFMGSFPEL
jgi:hypothetical protein